MLERLERDAVAAVKARDDNRRDTLRFVLSAIRNEGVARLGRAIDKLSAEGKDEAARKTWVDDNKPDELDDQGVLDVLRKQAKMRRDSIEAFDKGGREELAARERAQLAVIESYMPQQLDADSITAIVRRVIAETGASGPRDMNKVMPKVMAETKDQADGKTVSGIVAGLLKG